MKILSFGAGAIGAYIGGSLALAGHQVLFLERPAGLKILQKNGLKLTINEQTQTIPNPWAADNLRTAFAAGPFDLALFALKSYDTQVAVKEMQPYAAEFPPILCLQNGVENEPVLASLLGPNRVISGTVTSAVAREQVGEIQLEKLRGIGIAADHALSTELVGAMNEAGLNARLYANPGDMKWSKLVTNLPANASSAILGMTPAEIYAHPDLFRLEKAQLLEALAVMKAQNIQIVNLPGTPVRALIFAIQHLLEPFARSVLTRGIGGGRGGKMPSFYLDLHSGRQQSEVDYLNGAVVRFGKSLGIPTPANRTLTDTLLALIRRDLPLDDFAGQPEALLARYRAAKNGL